MKKLFFFALFLVGNYGAYAEDVLQVVPQVIESHLTENDWETTFSVDLVNTNEYTALQFDIYLPEGMTLIEEDPMDLNQDRFEGSKRKPFATYGVTDKGNGHYLITLYHENLEKIKGTEGNLFKFYYLTNNMQPGVYPIIIKNIELTITGTNYVQIPSTTSYVVVGNPTNASLTMEGEIPSFVNEKLATETAITSLNLSAVTKVNGTFTYVDGRAVTAPTGADVKADKAVYSRTVGAGNYASLKAPFAATGCSNLYTLDNNSDNLGSEWVNFTEAATVAAGDNLLVKGDIALSAENVALGDVAAAHAEYDVYYVKNGIFYHGNNITINPLRACWKLQGVNANLMIAINGEPTGIKLSTVDSLDTPTYDLQGRRSEKAQHGIFVTNGKKQIIK